MNKKPLKIAKRVGIANLAVTKNNLAKALDFSKKPSKKYRFLDVAIGIYPGALVLSWAVEGVGFGEVTYYLNKGKLGLDSEGMSDEFVMALQQEVLKKQKTKKLKIQYSDNLLESFFLRADETLKKK
jgi:hypothetical protein